MPAVSNTCRKPTAFIVIPLNNTSLLNFFCYTRRFSLQHLQITIPYCTRFLKNFTYIMFDFSFDRHNIHHFIGFVEEIRNSIQENRFEELSTRIQRTVRP